MLHQGQGQGRLQQRAQRHRLQSRRRYVKGSSESSASNERAEHRNSTLKERSGDGKRSSKKKRREPRYAYIAHVACLCLPAVHVIPCCGNSLFCFTSSWIVLIVIPQDSTDFRNVVAEIVESFRCADLRPAHEAQKEPFVAAASSPEVPAPARFRN